MIEHIETPRPDPGGSPRERRADFAAFVAEVEPRLRRAMVGAVGMDQAPDAVAEALAYAWANWSRVQHMDNPAGYLYRVARSSSRIRTPRRVRWLIPRDAHIPDVEPDLAIAVAELPARQRTSVWLVHACEWTHAEVAEALGISPSAVSTHVARGMKTLRRRLGGLDD